MKSKNADVAAFALIVIAALALHDWVHYRKVPDLVLGLMASFFFCVVCWHSRLRRP